MTDLRHLIRALGSVVIVVTAMACGGSAPASPTATPVDLSGTWSGTWTFLSAGVTVTDTVEMTITQSGGSAVGLWTASTGPGGRAVFNVTATTVNGSTTLSQVLLAGPICTTSAAMSGTASSSRVQFTLGTVPTSGLCQWATNQQFTFSR